MPQANLGATINELQHFPEGDECFQRFRAYLQAAGIQLEQGQCHRYRNVNTRHSRSNSSHGRPSRSNGGARLERIQEDEAPDLRNVLRGRDIHENLNEHHREREEAELRRHLEYDRDFGAPGLQDEEGENVKRQEAELSVMTLSSSSGKRSPPAIPSSVTVFGAAEPCRCVVLFTFHFAFSSSAILAASARADETLSATARFRHGGKAGDACSTLSLDYPKVESDSNPVISS